ncbi:hypothetical protein [Sinorhizobium medicae]|uniref:hypothetical protein n=1 Tax=Sinorhizobium medicae TaxID=110321 RepID=UPI0013E3FAEC|nr:hypothetical protein [Sinorhizobium medicae]
MRSVGPHALDDRKVNATVGPGEIEVRNEYKSAALEQDGTSTLPLDELNRDADQVYQITEDKHVDVEVYLSTNSLDALGTAFAATKTSRYAACLRVQ